MSRSVRRVAAALVLGAAALVCSPSAGAASAVCSDGGPCVVVRVVGDHGTIVTTQEFSVAALAAGADLTNPPYQVRSAPGGGVQDEPRPASAMSIQKLATSVPTGPGTFLAWQSVTYAQVFDRAGGSHELTNQQLGDPGSNGFADGLMPAVYVVGENDAVGYIRPLIDDNDVNGPDFIQTDSHAALEVTLHTSGTILRPTVTATAPQVEVGQSDTFAVSFAQPPSTALTYAWDFQDGTSSADASPSHTWSTAGTYYVSVTVQGDDGSYGRSAGVRVQVGTPPSPTSSPTTGPSNPGPTHHTHGPTSGPTHGGGHHQGGTPTSSPSSTAGPTSSPTAAPTASPTAAPTTGPTSSATPSAAPTTHASSTPSSAPSTQPPTHTPGPRHPHSGRPVSGTLLLAAQPFDPTRVRLSSVEAAHERQPSLPGRGWAWLGVLVVPLLAGLGMAREAMQLRRRKARMGS